MRGEVFASASSKGRHSGARHWAGFFISGFSAFLTDAAILEAGIRLLNLHPLLARLIAISLAMVVGWLSHRTLTFALRSRATVGEFANYAAMAWTAAAVNYAMFAAILYVRPETWPFVALVLASAVAAVFSYLAMRYKVFRGRR